MSHIDAEERPMLYEFALEKIRGAKHILDCACGDGTGTRIIASGLPETPCVGIDLSSDLIRRAKSLNIPNASFEVGNALSLAYPDGFFDAVVSCHTIEHFSEADQKRLVSELKRVLRPGGTLVIATPDVDVWRLLGIAGQQEDHVKELTQPEFVEMIRNAGLEVREVFGQNPLQQGNFPLRRILNTLKRLDVFRLRRLLGKSVRAIDKKTQPTAQDVSVVPLKEGEKASVTVLLARRA